MASGVFVGIAYGNRLLPDVISSVPTSGTNSMKFTSIHEHFLQQNTVGNVAYKIQIILCRPHWDKWLRWQTDLLIVLIKTLFAFDQRLVEFPVINSLNKPVGMSTAPSMNGLLTGWQLLLIERALSLTAIFIRMMTSSNGNIFRVTGHFCGESTGPRWIPRTKASGL